MDQIFGSVFLGQVIRIRKQVSFQRIITFRQIFQKIILVFFSLINIICSIQKIGFDALLGQDSFYFVDFGSLGNRDFGRVIFGTGYLSAICS